MEEKLHQVTGLNKFYKALQGFVSKLDKGQLINEHDGKQFLKKVYEAQDQPGKMAGQLYKELAYSFETDQEVIAITPMLPEEFSEVITRYYSEVRNQEISEE